MLKAILVLSGVSAFFMVLGVYFVLTEKRRLVSKRIKEVAASIDKETPKVNNDERGISKGKGLLRLLGNVLSSRQLRNNIGEELLKADILLRPEEFIAIIILAIIGGGIGGFIFNGAGASIVFSILGFITPLIFLNHMKKKRMNKLNSQMADCLGVMTNSLRAGFSFMQTLDQVGKELIPPLGTEFARTTREIGLGLTVEEALQNMANRLESDDLDLMVTAVLIQRQIGGNLAEILDNITATIRERVRLKAEVRTITAQARASGWIVGLLPVVMFAALSVLNPDYMAPFFNTTLGLILLVGAVVSELIGVYIISRIVQIDY